jgi:hypothetical protein
MASHHHCYSALKQARALLADYRRSEMDAYVQRRGRRIVIDEPAVRYDVRRIDHVIASIDVALGRKPQPTRTYR